MKWIITKKIEQTLSFFLVGLMIFFLLGCYHHYYKVKQIRHDELSSIAEIGRLYKHFVVRAGHDLFTLKNIGVESDYILGEIDTLDRIVYHDPYDRKKNRSYKRKKEKDVLHEVHIYLDEKSGSLEPGPLKIPYEDVEKIEIIDKNTGLTIASYVVSTIGTIVGVTVIVAAIASCPYAYVYNGETFVFEGEIYGGAVLQNLERHDYLPLPSIMAENGKFKLRISNELQEHQYTNLAELIIINHPKDRKVLLDKKGQAQIFGEPNLPISALSLEGKDLTSLIAEKDDISFLFNDEGLNKNAAELTFSKPSNVEVGKLLLRAKNIVWGDYVLNKFLKMFGSYYNTWIKEVKKATPEIRQQAVIENHFPLTVHVKKNNNWQVVEHLWTVGPMASRDLVVPIDLRGIEGDEIELKLETGFLFWDLDFAAMDYTENTNLDVYRQFPEKVITSDGRDWKATLMADDNQYLVQKRIGDLSELHFKTVPYSKDQAQSIFLHTKGYYEIIRDFEGAPQWDELREFKKPGYNMEFSRQEYFKFKAKMEKEALSSINE